MLAKAATLPADEIVLDLEDAVAPAEKDGARDAAIAAIAAGDLGERRVAVRINPVGTRWCHRDVIELVGRAGARLESLVVPKVERAADLEFVAALVHGLEQETGRSEAVRLQALIETAAGLGAVREIAAATPRTEALIVGYADLAASLGHPPGGGAHEDRWAPARQAVLVAARAAGLRAIDGPWLDLRDEDGLRTAAERARADGYDGKWAIHPGQLELLNDLFTPSAEELERARAVLDALAAAERDGAGAAMLNGEMVDEASRKHALAVTARAGLANQDRTSPGAG
jgi:citrate lyase subunit beta/citryl-CoA lyase